MTEDERILWELFCTTGEPRYYSMYSKIKSEREHGRNGE